MIGCRKQGQRDGSLSSFTEEDRKDRAEQERKIVRKGATERRRKSRAMGRLLRRRSQTAQASVGRSSGAALERDRETYLTLMFCSDAPLADGRRVETERDARERARRIMCAAMRVDPG